jgi:hypothetical protein
MDTTVSFGIAGLAILMAAAVAGMVWLSDRRSFPKVFAAIILLMAIQLVAAKSGILEQWNRKPPLIAPLILISLVLTVVLALSPAGDSMIRKVSLPILIIFQVFRLPLELVMHRAATHGIMPNQMSFSGYNFDILSGVLALPAARLAANGNRGVVIAWNTLGSALLAAIIVIAVLSLPAIAAFGPNNLNTWVADAPYIWLPGVLVPAALLGHLLIWRSLRQRP